MIFMSFCPNYNIIEIDPFWTYLYPYPYNIAVEKDEKFSYLKSVMVLNALSNELQDVIQEDYYPDQLRYFVRQYGFIKVQWVLAAIVRINEPKEFVGMNGSSYNLLRDWSNSIIDCDFPKDELGSYGIWKTDENLVYPKRIRYTDAFKILPTVISDLYKLFGEQISNLYRDVGMELKNDTD